MDEIVGMVLLQLNQDQTSIEEQMEFGGGVADLRKVVRMVLPGVAREVVLTCERGEMNEWLEGEMEVEWTMPGQGRVQLPGDYLRLVRFRMSDWKRSVSKETEAGSLVYSLRFGGCRPGRRSEPAVCVDCKELEFTGSEDPGAYVEDFRYLPEPYDREREEFWIPSALLGRVVEVAAEKVREFSP